ncbi:hypothetical protein [Paraburkholderia sp. J67]|uniref:hypothetical protein n=1 Tax=Paraburkholderia sp. J67 TaxID=2805435 RepID=UPI002ABD2BBC|nr:hypothetical protein [Paraburkholderia sp. J67]
MHRGLSVLLAVCLFHSSFSHAQLPVGTTLSHGAGLEEATLTRIDDRDGTLLVFKVKTETMSLHDQGAALEDLLNRSIRQHSLPDHFDVRLGATRIALIKELQKKLLQPGANWNLANGRPRAGDLNRVLSDYLTALVAQSPIGIAFVHHGYTLSVSGLEHIEEEPKKFPRVGARVPTDIFVLEITAERIREP